jgi:hypothetical protein
MRIHYYIIGAVLSLALMLPSLTTAKVKVVPRMYMFGFAASFNDTIVHFTEIQAVDSVWYDTKNRFMLGREHYSQQLRNHLADRDMPARTSIVFFNKKPKRLQKKYQKMMKLYAGTKKSKSHNDIRTIGGDEFKFMSVNMDNTVIEDEPVVVETKKDKKKKRK